MSYWSAAICRTILWTVAKRITVSDIVQDTWILPEDVIATLKDMDVVESEHGGNGALAINRARVKTWGEMNKMASETTVDRNAFAEAFNGEARPA